MSSAALRGLCIVAVALVAVGAGRLQPSGSAATVGAVPDQANAVRPSACRYSAWVPDDATSWTAQTVTAGISGALSDVVLPLRVGSSPVVVAITPVDADGRPAVGAPLAVTTLTADTTSPAWTDTTVSFSTPPRIRAGQPYAIVLSAPTTDPASERGVAWRLDLGSSFHDLAGQACGDGAYAAGRAWASSGVLGTDADYFFRTYVVPARIVTVATAGSGNGSVRDGRGIDCGLSCAGEYLTGERVSLTATPDPGSSFGGWTGGGCAVTDPSCTFTVGDDSTVTARFTRILVHLGLLSSGRGTITADPGGIRCAGRCSHALAPGSVLELRARPARGWRFARWGGACHGTGPTCRLDLVRARVVTATFTR